MVLTLVFKLKTQFKINHLADILLNNFTILLLEAIALNRFFASIQE